MPDISLTSVSLTYASSQKQTEALTNVSLEIPAGESVVLIGPSGCGKSSLLQLIDGLRPPTSGSVCIAGEQMQAPRKRTSFIFQDYGLLPWKTVQENVALGLKIQHRTHAEANDRAKEALATVGLSGFETSFPGELSGGMRQRVALARSMASQADIVLMDEPLSALDALTREELQDSLLDLGKTQGYTQILVTHSIEEAVYLGRLIVVLTPRPGTVKAVLSNAGAGEAGYRHDSRFYQRCSELRDLLEREGAFA